MNNSNQKDDLSQLVAMMMQQQQHQQQQQQAPMYLGKESKVSMSIETIISLVVLAVIMTTGFLKLQGDISKLQDVAIMHTKLLDPPPSTLVKDLGVRVTDVEKQMSAQEQKLGSIVDGIEYIKNKQDVLARELPRGDNPYNGGRGGR